MSRVLGRRDFLKVFGTGAAGVALLGAVGCGARGQRGSENGESGESASGKVYKIRLSHAPSAESTIGKGAEIFKKKVEEKSGDRVEVEIFPSGKLYGQVDELQALQSGAIESVVCAAALVTSISPKFLLFDLPFVFDTQEDIPKIISRDTAIGKAIYGDPILADANMRMLGVTHAGFKQLTSNTEMRTPGDLRGLKMRILASDVLRSQMNAWGANPTAMDLGELYNALQQGVVDGQENDYSTAYTFKLHEVQSNLTESAHGYNLDPILLNTDFLESLPEDLQQAVVEAAEETGPVSLETTGNLNAKDKKRIEAAGTTQILVPSEDERQAFRNEVVPRVWNEHADVIGPELVEELKAYYGQ